MTKVTEQKFCLNLNLSCIIRLKYLMNPCTGKGVLYKGKEKKEKKKKNTAIGNETKGLDAVMSIITRALAHSGLHPVQPGASLRLNSRNLRWSVG